MNRVSQFVFDPERFREDQKEPMSAKEMGALYTRISKHKEETPLIVCI